MAVRQRTSCGLFLHLIAVALGVRAAPAGPCQAEVLNASELDAGFRLLYELKPEEARAQFAVWQTSHPEDPLGSASEAASYLFEECYRQGVLTSEFFLDNKRFLGKIAIQPDQEALSAELTLSATHHDRSSGIICQFVVDGATQKLARKEFVFMHLFDDEPSDRLPVAALFHITRMDRCEAAARFHRDVPVGFDQKPDNLFIGWSATKV